MNSEFINGNGRIEALREKERSIRAAIAAENLKQQKREAKNRRHLVELVGTALIDQANASPELQLMLKQILGGAVTDSAARKFLGERGFI